MADSEKANAAAKTSIHALLSAELRSKQRTQFVLTPLGVLPDVLCMALPGRAAGIHCPWWPGWINPLFYSVKILFFILIIHNGFSVFRPHLYSTILKPLLKSFNISHARAFLGCPFIQEIISQMLVFVSSLWAAKFSSGCPVLSVICTQRKTLQNVIFC